MDKLKIFFAVVKKHQFWVLCGAMLITSLVCWWLATSSLVAKYQQREAKINKAFQGVVVQPDHPNQKVIDETNKLHASLKRNVYGAWEILYREQKEKNPFPTKVLGKDFKRQFESLKPKDNLDPQYRELYQNFIKGYFPTLLEKIDVRHPIEHKAEGNDKAGAAAGIGRLLPRRGGAAPGMGTGMGMGAGMGMGGRGDEQEWTGIVDWNESDYAQLLERFEWQATPSTLAVVLAQEDLWVYEALLRVIENANEGATNQSNAAVKQIDALQIGADAALAWESAKGTILSATTGGAKGGGMGAMPGPGGMGAMPGPGGMGAMPGPGGMGAMPGPGGMGAMPGPGGMGAMPGATADGAADDPVKRQLIQNRYVDDKEQPLPYEPQFPYAKHPYAEFKMMPIHMSLVMDQRHLPKLLVECANSNMPIEVRRIRITKTQGKTLNTGASATPAAGGMGGAMMGGMGRPLQRQPNPGMGGGLGQNAGNQQQGAGQYEIPVEIQGIIYIYNPPDREKLGTGAAAVKKPAEVAPPAEVPATPPAAGTTPPDEAPGAPPVAAPAMPPAAQPTPPAVPPEM